MVKALGLASRLSSGAGSFRLGPLDLDLPAGAFGALLGPSGAGKTTLMRSLAGLIPAEGELTLGLSRREAWPPERRPIGWVPQGGGLFPHLSARSNVELVRLAVAPATDLLLERVGARHLADRSPLTLSGGEVLRVALARALARQPEVLLLDEPLAAIDRASREPLLRLLAELARGGTTLLEVTHDADQALATATWLGVLETGQLVAAGPTDRLFDEALPAVARRALGGDNVLFGRFGPHGEGLSTFRSRRLALSVPGDLEGEGYAIFPATAVGLAAHGEARTSVRNQTASRIHSLDLVGPTVEVRLECGVLASVTREAVHELGMEPGTNVTLEIKATAIRPVLRCY
jgi:putrescine transport system ATP-binding protein